MPDTKPASEAETIRLRHPCAEDGPEVHALIGRCAPLDPNSLYCNVLQCSHFSKTCALAERGGKLAGFASAFIEPNDPKALFVWQVAVDRAARGLGLGARLIVFLLDAPACANVRKLHATIGDGNHASWGMFEKVARRLGAPTSRRLLFDKNACFGGAHESEILLTVGPFNWPMSLKYAS